MKKLFLNVISGRPMETLARQCHRRSVLWVITGLGCEVSRSNPKGTPFLEVSNELVHLELPGLSIHELSDLA